MESMKKLILLSLLGGVFWGCNNPQKTSEDQATEKAAVVYSIDELYAKALELEGKEVVVKGTVMHVCRHGGGRCFLMGSTEDMNIRVEAGEKIGAFSQEQMGSDLTVQGIFKEVKTEADAHNPQEPHEGEEAGTGHDSGADEAHRVISGSREEGKPVYFIEGLQILGEDI